MVKLRCMAHLHPILSQDTMDKLPNDTFSKTPSNLQLAHVKIQSVTM